MEDNMWLKDRKWEEREREYKIKRIKKELEQEKFKKILELIQKFPVKKQKIKPEPTFYRILW